MIEVCPVVMKRKDERIVHYRKEEEKWLQNEIYPFSKYAMERYPDICIGNCENCEKWKLVTEKELFINDVDTDAERIKYELWRFAFLFFTSTPLMFFIAFIMGNIFFGFFLSFAFAVIFTDYSGVSYNEWLDKKWEEQNRI